MNEDLHAICVNAQPPRAVDAREIVGQTQPRPTYHKGQGAPHRGVPEARDWLVDCPVTAIDGQRKNRGEGGPCATLLLSLAAPFLSVASISTPAHIPY